jgi:hypothetical protein
LPKIRSTRQQLARSRNQNKLPRTIGTASFERLSLVILYLISFLEWQQIGCSNAGTERWITTSTITAPPSNSEDSTFNNQSSNQSPTKLTNEANSEIPEEEESTEK